MDGHERPDVVFDQTHRFLPAWRDLLARSVWTEKTDEGFVLIRENAPNIIVTTDEKIHCSGDLEKT